MAQTSVSSTATAPGPSPRVSHNAPNAESSPSDKPQMRKFSHTFWSPEVAPLRAMYIKAFAGTFVCILLVMWICLPVYWGSLAHQRSYPNKLDVLFVNRDASDIGNSIQAVVHADFLNTTHAKLGWRIRDPSQYPTDDAVQHAVLEERYWMAVVVHAGATQNLVTARATGNSSYDPTRVISVFYTQARNENAAGNFLVPYSQALLSQAIANFSSAYAKQFFTEQGGNATAMAILAQAPQTVAQPVYWTYYNLRPFTAPVATAILLVGSIYLIIFSFVITMTGYAVRAPLEPFLTTRDLLYLRICAPLIFYIPLSLSYSMISLCFKVPFQAKFSHAGGFFLYWIFVYMAMASLGLATEFMIQLLTPKFMTFFLFPLIISNVSVASLPIALEPWFYKYGYGFPVYNIAQATRTIIFDTKSHLGLNAGVLVAWIAISLCTISAITLHHRRKHRRAHKDAEAARTPSEKQRAVEEEQEAEAEVDARDDPMVGYMRGEKSPEQRAEEEDGEYFRP